MNSFFRENFKILKYLIQQLVFTFLFIQTGENKLQKKIVATKLSQFYTDLVLKSD